MPYSRTILPPQGDSLHLLLPNDLKNIGLEVIILPSVETVGKPKNEKKEKISVRLKRAFANMTEEQKIDMDT